MTVVVSTAMDVERTAKPRLFQRFFSFPVMLAFLLAALAILTARSRFDDPDMWWHLKMGQVIWTTHSIPTTDTFSYTTNHHAYTPHEWLSQLSIYGAYRIAGYTGLMFWLWLLESALLITGYILCSSYSENSKVAFLGAMTIWLFSTIGLAVRPQLLGYLFLVIELLLLNLGQRRNPRWFFVLPPLFAIWVNCHGSFFLGLIVAIIVLASSFLRSGLGLLAPAAWTPLHRRMLATSLLLSVAALAINPVGKNQVLYPLEAILHLPINLTQVQEWQPLHFGESRAFALLAVIFCVFLLVIVRQAEFFWQELILLGLATWLATSHSRMLFAFGILTAPILSRLIAPLWDTYTIERDHPIPNALFIVGSIFTICWAFPAQQRLLDQMELNSPARAVQFIKNNHLSGRMLNEYVFGGYLIWAAPAYPVFVDGRGDVFEETGVLSDLSNWMTLQNSPDLLLKKYQIDFCLLARQNPMVTALQLMHWKVIYSDNNAAVLVQDFDDARSQSKRTGKSDSDR